MRPGRTAPGAVGEAGRPAAGREGAEQVGIQDEFGGVVAPAQRRQGAHQQVVLGGSGFAVDVRELLRRLGHGGRHRVAAIVRGDVSAVGALGHGLRDDVQGAPGNQLEIGHHERFQPGAEPAAGAPDALRHRTHLAVVLGQQGDDPVGLAQLMGAQYDGVITVGARCEGLLDHS